VNINSFKVSFLKIYESPIEIIICYGWKDQESHYENLSIIVVVMVSKLISEPRRTNWCSVNTRMYPRVLIKYAHVSRNHKILEKIEQSLLKCTYWWIHD